MPYNSRQTYVCMCIHKDKLLLLGVVEHTIGRQVQKDLKLRLSPKQKPVSMLLTHTWGMQEGRQTEFLFKEGVEYRAFDIELNLIHFIMNSQLFSFKQSHIK